MKYPSFVLECENAVALMSPFIDSMVTVKESETLRLHLAECSPCRRHLQALVSLRTVFARAEMVAPPATLPLSLRLRLSRERAFTLWERLHMGAENLFRPFALPAVTGVLVTVLGFGILFAGLFSPRTALAQYVAVADPQVTVYAPPQTTNRTLLRLEANDSPDLDHMLSVQAQVCATGRVCDFTLIEGKRSAEVDRWLQEVLLLAQFRPATTWGAPVASQVVFSFVNVRG